MSSKKQANSHDQSLLGHHGAQIEAQSAEVHDQSIAPTGAIQKARAAPGLLTSHDLLQLQRTVGNRVVSKLLSSTRPPHQRSAGSASQSQPVIQRAYYYWDHASKSFLYSYGVASMTSGIRLYKDRLGNTIAHGGHSQTWITNEDWQKVQDDRVLENYYQNRGQLPSEDIPAELTNGITEPMTEQTIARKVFENINNFRFRYIGRLVNPRAAFYAHQGDCQTLVGMYQVVAEELGITFDLGERRGAQLVAPRPIHGRDVQSNTHDGDAWFFDEHYWAIGAGTAYDLLFMVSPPPPVTLSIGTTERKGVTYHRFSDGRCFIKKGEKALKVQLQGEGRVFASQAATRDFIDDNTDG